MDVAAEVGLFDAYSVLRIADAAGIDPAADTEGEGFPKGDGEPSVESRRTVQEKALGSTYRP